MTKFNGVSFFLLVGLAITCLRAASFENDVVKVELGRHDGVHAWFSKKYQEDFFGVDVAHDTNDVVWTSAGIRFGYLPNHLSRAAAGPTVTMTTGLPEGIYQFSVEDPLGATLPKGVNVSVRWSFSTRYSARVGLTIVNNTKDILKLDDDLRGPVALYAFPLFRDDIYRTEAIAMTKSGDVEKQSPVEGSITPLADGCRWVGMRNQYYAFGLHETSSNGRYLMTSVKTIVKADEGRKEKRFSAPIVAWKFAWPALRPEERLEATFDVYLGPKQDVELAGTPFERLFDTWEGMTGPIGRLMFALLQQLQQLTGSYGYAILLLTMLVKIVLIPLNKKQMTAMKKMQQLQPKMQEIKEKYKEDQTRQNAELQKLFIEHQVNPLGSCLPILIQIPIFIALYTCLSSAIELKKAPFLWLPDLSQPDELRLLPILFCVSIYYSSQANASGDPNQATMMKVMPVFMLFIFWNMAAGVMLYITGQSLFSMVEQQCNKMGSDDKTTAVRQPVLVGDAGPKKKSKRKE